MSSWDESAPIYLQLRAQVVRRIMTGSLPEGEAIPSVRQVSADEKINPLTVSKAYQMLVDENLVEKRRGVGMFVADGAQKLAVEQERQRFIGEEWPRVMQRIESLGLSAKELLADSQRGDS